jgi:hypothetical protein
MRFGCFRPHVNGVPYKELISITGQPLVKVRIMFTTDGQSASLSWCQTPI